jgi:glycine/D-amino acid oxidase-like deaminating enzyme
MKSAAKNTLLVLGISFLCLLALEGLTRLILDDGKLYELEMWKYAREIKVRDLRSEIGHRHRQHAEAQLMGVTIRTNSRGFRSPEIDEKAEAGVARIAFVGDSITLGWGVAEHETFAQQVVDALAKSGRKVETFNLGVGNYNTSQELALFRDVGARLKPDIIVLCYFINDAEPMPEYSSDDWLSEHSAAWVVFRYRLDSLLRQFGDSPDWKHYYRALYDPDAAGWARTRNALSEFAATARELGAELVVFHIPELRELKPYPFGDVTAQVRAVVERERVPFVDLLPTIEDLDPSSLWVTVPDPHPNGKADSAFAKGMIPAIMPMLDGLCRNQGKACRNAP